MLLCRVDVFPLQVVRQRKSWPEKDQRVTEWFTPAEAAELVHEPELSELIKAFEAMISRGGDSPASDHPDERSRAAARAISATRAPTSLSGRGVTPALSSSSLVCCVCGSTA